MCMSVCLCFGTHVNVCVCVCVCVVHTLTDVRKFVKECIHTKDTKNTHVYILKCRG